MRTLKNALASGRVGHAFLLSGARGVGKTTTARILAKALNCSKTENATPEPCGECSSCEEIAAGTSLDVQEIDGATHNGVEQVRELRESARYNPARDRFKIWIIDEVHMLSTGAFNALLKTLEEPPPRVKFIFATTEYHKLPDTILSRCQQYDLRLIPARELVAHLREVAAGEKVSVSDETLGRIARAAEGSVRDALSLFDQVLSFSGGEVRDEDVSALLGLIDRELLLAVSQAVVQADSRALLETVERLTDYGADYRNFARELLLHFRELLVIKVAAPDSRLLDQMTPEERERLRPIAEAFSEEDLLRTLDVLTAADSELRLAQDPRVSLELALLKLVQLRRLMPFVELVARVERLAAGVGPEQISTRAPGPVARRARDTAPAGPSPETPAQAAATHTPVQTAPSPGSAGPPDSPDSPDGQHLLARMLEQATGRPSLTQPVRRAAARLDGAILTLSVIPHFLAMAASHCKEYEELARTAAGRKIKVVVEAGQAEQTDEEESLPAEEHRRQQLVEQAARDPTVKEVVDLFDGKVVAVQEDKQGRS